MPIQKIPIQYVPKAEIETWVQSATDAQNATGTDDKHMIRLKSRYHKRLTLQVASDIDNPCARRYVYVAATHGALSGTPPNHWDSKIVCDIGQREHVREAKISDNAAHEFHVTISGEIGVGSALIPQPKYSISPSRCSWS